MRRDNAVDHKRRDLKPRRAGHGEDPRGREVLHVGLRDLFERAVAVAGVGAVVTGPVALRLHGPLGVCVAVA